MAILECKNLTKRYGDITVLEDVSCAIRPGRVVGLFGPSGSGKTTFLKLAAGLLASDGGSLTVCGMEPGRESFDLVSYLPERTCELLWKSSREIIGLYQNFFPGFDGPAAAEMLERFGIPPELEIGKLSTGNRVKAQLSLAMSRRAKLYLLDDPIGGVSGATRSEVRSIIGCHDPESAVILSTHFISDVEPILDDVIFLDQGRVVLQTSADRLRQETGKSVEEVFMECFAW